MYKGKFGPCAARLLMLNLLACTTREDGEATHNCWMCFQLTLGGIHGYWLFNFSTSQNDLMPGTICIAAQGHDPLKPNVS